VTSPSLKTCCREEAARSLARYRDVAICDRCGQLLLAYGNDRDYRSTLEELARHDVAFETGRVGALRVVAKPRTSSPGPRTSPPSH
jgi:hypothetical protein